MGIRMKKLTVIISLAIAATSFTYIPATAAERPTSVAGCKKPTSQAHQPASLKQPTAPDKTLAKTMVFNTNCGVISISLNSAAPQTVTNMSTLARAKYFDGSFCHRLTTEGIFVLQCGDPSAQGNGSPGTWKGYKEENLPKDTANNYPVGTVAMANAGPGTNGSQFFLVYKNTTLPPNYTIWGKITAGLPLMLRMQKVGAYKVDQASGKGYYTGDGLPLQPLEIKSVIVR